MATSLPVYDPKGPKPSSGLPFYRSPALPWVLVVVLFLLVFFMYASNRGPPPRAVPSQLVTPGDLSDDVTGTVRPGRRSGAASGRHAGRDGGRRAAASGDMLIDAAAAASARDNNDDDGDDDDERDGDVYADGSKDGYGDGAAGSTGDAGDRSDGKGASGGRRAGGRRDGGKAGARTRRGGDAGDDGKPGRKPRAGKGSDSADAAAGKPARKPGKRAPPQPGDSDDVPLKQQPQQQQQQQQQQQPRKGSQGKKDGASGASKGDGGQSGSKDGDKKGSKSGGRVVTRVSDSKDTEYESADNTRRRDTVKAAMEHAWGGYVKHAWGQDELRPSSNSGMNWLGLGATIVDSLDTLWIMGLEDEFKRARDWIDRDLNFNRNSEVSFFETTIRALGGLASAFDLTGDQMFMHKAVDLAGRLSWAFNTSAGIPWASINLGDHSGRSPGWTGGASILAEIGTVQLEFKDVAYHSGQRYLADKADAVIDRMRSLQKPAKGLYPIYISPHSGQFTSSQVTLGALGDSFFEYLLKQYLQTDRTERKYLEMYQESADGIIEHMVRKSSPSGLTYVAEWNGGGINDKMDHLACFAAGMFALGSRDAPTEAKRAEQLRVGAEIAETCYQTYARQPSGIGPEMVHFRAGQDFVNGAGHYILRPETVEALFILWRMTHEQKWRDHAWDIMQALDKHCRTSTGYAGLRDVGSASPMRDDQQQSFFLAETLKYLYLIFCPDDVINLDQWVFNTEAHPLRVISDYPFARP